MGFGTPFKFYLYISKVNSLEFQYLMSLLFNNQDIVKPIGISNERKKDLMKIAEKIRKKTRASDPELGQIKLYYGKKGEYLNIEKLEEFNPKKDSILKKLMNRNKEVNVNSLEFSIITKPTSLGARVRSSILFFEGSKYNLILFHCARVRKEYINNMLLKIFNEVMIGKIFELPNKKLFEFAKTFDGLIKEIKKFNNNIIVDTKNVLIQMPLTDETIHIKQNSNIDNVGLLLEYSNFLKEKGKLKSKFMTFSSIELMIKRLGEDKESEDNKPKEYKTMLSIFNSGGGWKPLRIFTDNYNMGNDLTANIIDVFIKKLMADE